MLSDPYQRGRYDEQRSQALDDGAIDVDDDVDDRRCSTNGGRRATPRSRHGDQTPAVRAASANSRRRRFQPPAGTRYPPTKQRILAMAIDLGRHRRAVRRVAVHRRDAREEPAAGRVQRQARRWSTTRSPTQQQGDGATPRRRSTTAKKGTDQAGDPSRSRTRSTTPRRRKTTTINKQLDGADNKLTPIAMTR